MPHIVVKLYEGRGDAEKRALADRLAATLAEVLGSRDASISVAIEDVKPDDWMTTVYAPEIEAAGERLFKRPGYGPLAEG